VPKSYGCECDGVWLIVMDSASLAKTRCSAFESSVIPTRVEWVSVLPPSDAGDGEVIYRSRLFIANL